MSARLKNQKTFKANGFKRVLCRGCANIIGETHLGEKKTRTVKCRECKNWQTIAPPRYGKQHGNVGIFWCEPSDSCWTAC